MLENFNHGDYIKTLRGKWQIFTAPLHARDGFPKRLQMRHMKINPANVIRSPRNFFRVTPIAAPKVEDPLAIEIQDLIHFPHALADSIRAVGYGTSKLDRAYSRRVFKLPSSN